jgi:hypothetical protein
MDIMNPWAMRNRSLSCLDTMKLPAMPTSYILSKDHLGMLIDGRLRKQRPSRDHVIVEA